MSGPKRFRLGKRRFYIGHFSGMYSFRHTLTHAVEYGEPLCGVRIIDKVPWGFWRAESRYDIQCKRCWAMVNGGRPKLAPDHKRWIA